MSQPQYSVSGQPTNDVVCGTTIGFDVPGYQRAWVIVAQDGHITFDAPMDLPMPQYALKCPQDVGFFQTAAYEITPQGTRGNVIGQTQITVRQAPMQTTTPQTPTQPTQPTTPGGGTAPPIIPVGGGGGGIDYTGGGEPTEAGFFSGMDTTTLILLGVGALLVLPQLFQKKRGQ